jgi:hypothetical protein
MLISWAVKAHEAVSTRLGLTDCALSFRSREWPWELEKLVLR